MTITVRPFRPTDLEHVTTLVADAHRTDGVAPLNEESTLALHDTSGEARVFVAQASADSSTDDVVAVLVDAHGDGSGCDLVTLPAARRGGAASALVQAWWASHDDDASDRPHLWAHGGLDAAQAFATARGFTPVRDLWRMARPLTGEDEFDIALPDGLRADAFDGSDAQAQAWLDVNAAAFAHHPEQGRMTMADLRERMRQPWFDPSGLILVWDEATGALAASHWTKREPGEAAGEVYVVAVAPGYQGRGIAGPLTDLGLAHLRDSGATRVELYVEGDNEPAKATYTRRGFVRDAHDVMYVHSPAVSM